MRWVISRMVWPLAAAILVVPGLSGAQAPTTGVISGRVLETVSGLAIADVQVTVEGTTLGAATATNGSFVIRGVTPGTHRVTARRIGYGSRAQEVTVVAGQTATVTIALARAAMVLAEQVVTTLGQTAEQRALGFAQQTVQGADIAATQRENFINALQGRVAGVQVTSSSGVPGASSQITVRGISSISSSNQPLFIIDGLPMDNKTINTETLPSDFPGSPIAFSNRGLDFTNRAADLNPEDIESLVVLKGPEAAALYGIDAANGAIVITTKRGRSGTGGFEYSNNFRIESLRRLPDVQRVYGYSIGGEDQLGSATYLYWGEPYAPGTQFFDNVSGFFRTGTTQRHNLSFSGATVDNRINYRIATSTTEQEGVVPNSAYGRVNVTGASQAQVTPWLQTDLTMGYTYARNDQPFKGAGGPLLGLLVWPQTDDAKDFLTPAGTRRRITNLSAVNAEVDNPYFNVNKNKLSSRNNRIIANLGLVLMPFEWGSLKTNIGTDQYTNENTVLRHPESAFGVIQNGILDLADDITRSLNAQTLFNVHNRPLLGRVSVQGLLGHAVSDYKTRMNGLLGQNFLDPNFVSVNNTSLRSSRTIISQRRLVSGFGSVTLDYDKLLYVTVTGRNDWTSTIPRERNSFFYPSVAMSFIFSDAFPSIGNYVSGKLRAAYAEVGRDARPYAYRPALEFKTTSYGGYGYAFWGPNLNLKPEFARSYEYGLELSALEGRLGLDLTTYRKQTKDQIVNDIRGSYGTGFILFNLNGASTKNTGVEVVLRGTPLQAAGFAWDVVANFDRSRGRVVSLPHELPESYIADTWLYGNVRNGTGPGRSTRSLTGFFYLRNNNGDILIDPATGLPIRSSAFIDAGYDRQPDWTMGLTNAVRYRQFSLSALLDLRKGGDVFNATEHYLTARGLTTRTLDRNEPRVIPGVLRDGKENSANPTQNTIVVIPAVQRNYYVAMSEELFIEKDINWVRLRDVTLTMGLPQRFGRNASLFVTGTDLFLFTNYSGLDPIANGNTASGGGSSAVGVDFGNFPVPRAVQFGVRTRF